MAPRRVPNLAIALGPHSGSIGAKRPTLRALSRESRQDPGMASRKHALLEPTDDWQQLQFQLDWLEQTRYELIRPVVVFGAPPVERAQQTGVSASTIYQKVGRFDELGMQSLFEAEPAE